jgi:hypothetical protein
MSASDAAPLPRLGEVFFDVRGSSRSMRLSWYADTGVAVFSIWQGGMCTGTFRLPIGDLPRMIEILERGPDEPQSRSRSREHDWSPRETAGTGQREMPPTRLHYPDPDGRYPDEPRTGYSRADAAETAAVSYARDDPRRRGGYGIPDPAGPAGLGPEHGDYPQHGGQFGHDDFGADGYRGYDPPEPREPDSGGHRGSGGGYGQERFVPPYVQTAVGDYSSDIPARPGERPDDPMPEAYWADPPGGPSEDPDYLSGPWPPPGYSDGPRYRLADAAGQHSRGRHGKYLPADEPADGAV